jgi:brefeldin A-inhibited guanine nucleotide-exchange protein
MLFDPNLHRDQRDAAAPTNGSSSPNDQVVGMATEDRRRIFRQIIRKCVLQLLLIETTNELLQNTEVYATIPSEHLLQFLAVLEDSYRFARRFNADKDLRMALWKVG